MPEYIEFGQASEDQKAFVKTVLNVFSPFLEPYGFTKHRAQTGADSTIIVYRKDKLYIKIFGNTFPDENPHYYSINLGEGNSENVEDYNKNSIPLYLLKNSIDKLFKTLEDYPFPLSSELDESIEKAKEELLLYGATFLQGDLSVFRQILNERNEMLGF